MSSVLPGLFVLRDAVRVPASVGGDDMLHVVLLEMGVCVTCVRCDVVETDSTKSKPPGSDDESEDPRALGRPNTVRQKV
ncbi:hypothetical protein [Paraburkholderia sacchari]|uniref:hypothetical protein n=1 Tax=Paraburkholderia sacchari TaxID=159450 RepID=UPI003D999359